MRAMILTLLMALVMPVPSLAQDTLSRSINKQGEPIDPSENVKALSEAAAKRQDDLREASDRLNRSLLEAQEKLSAIRSDHLKELNSLRGEYESRLQIAEAKRIDAIRAVDVNAVAVASTRASDQALVLATQVSQSAEALRALVATTAATVAASQQQLANTLSARLTTLEQAGYQAAGKQTLQDPAFVALLAKVEALSVSRINQEGVGSGRGDVIGWIVGGVATLALIIGAFVTLTKRREP